MDETDEGLSLVYRAEALKHNQADTLTKIAHECRSLAEFYWRMNMDRTGLLMRADKCLKKAAELLGGV